MNIYQRKNEQGSVNGGIVTIVLLAVALAGLVGLSVWLYGQYNEYKNNSDEKVVAAVSSAKLKQAEDDAKKFEEKEKEPNARFAGPDDYGRLTFSYPKTWSLYVADDGSDRGDYKAFLNPVAVPPTEKENRFALRVEIRNDKFEDVVGEFNSLVTEGELKSSATSANGVSGTRYDGKFSDTIRGAAVVYKLRDKTVVIYTDANTFKPDFENIIKTIEFNQ